MYLKFDVRIINMALHGFMYDSREYFHPSFILEGVDRTQKLDLTNIGLGADFLSADLSVSQYDEFKGKNFLGRINWGIDPQHTTSIDREGEEYPHLRHHAHHVSIEIGLSKSNIDTFADNLKHLRLTKVTVDTNLFVQQGKFEEKLFRFSEPVFSSKAEQYGEALFYDYRFGFEYPAYNNEAKAVCQGFAARRAADTVVR